jgi:diadenosine tetraphosphatase ApaH/serine/threonine PP2A family protein phosphatase
MDQLVQSIINGKTDFTEDEVWHLTGMIQDYYRERPNVVEIPAHNIIFIGDLHGELESAISVKRYIQEYDNHFFVFLGDYADRGPAQVETINLAIALALAYPSRIVMLRGNHESEEVARRYGFYNAVLRGLSFGTFRYYTRFFESLPIAAYHSSAIFACHGGVPEGVSSIEEIQSCNRRNPNFPDEIIFQMVWNDPEEGDFGFRPSIRGAQARYFGQKAFDHFMKNIDAHIMFRAHEVVPEGYRILFQNRLVSVFSASYAGRVKPKIVRLGNDRSIEALSLP